MPRLAGCSARGRSLLAATARSRGQSGVCTRHTTCAFAAWACLKHFIASSQPAYFASSGFAVDLGRKLIPLAQDLGLKINLVLAHPYAQALFRVLGHGGQLWARATWQPRGQSATTLQQSWMLLTRKNPMRVRTETQCYKRPSRQLKQHSSNSRTSKPKHIYVDATLSVLASAADAWYAWYASSFAAYLSGSNSHTGYR